MKRAIAIFLLLSLLASCQRNRKSLNPEEVILAKVGSQSITLKHFAEAIRHHLSTDSLSKEEFQILKESTLQRLVTETLLLQEANRKNINLSIPEETSQIQKLKNGMSQEEWKDLLTDSGMTEQLWVAEQRKVLRIEKTLSSILADQLKISENDIQKYYLTHMDENQQPQKIRIQQILVSTPEKAEALRSQLLQGSSFSGLARKNSISPDATLGGDLGLLASEEMIPAFQEVWRMKVGEISQAIKSDYGYHLIMVLGRQHAKKLSINERREAIRLTLEEERRKIAYRNLLNTLYSQEEIKTYPKVLSAISLELVKELSL